MEKVNEQNCMNTLAEKFPKFALYWEAYVDEEGTDDGLTVKMIPFADYVIDLIKGEQKSVLQEVFDFVEYLICCGDESVHAAMTTSFLEYLLARDGIEIKFSTICPYLGKESKEYCRAWDEFCGVKTEGLWDNQSKLATASCGTASGGHREVRVASASPSLNRREYSNAGAGCRKIEFSKSEPDYRCGARAGVRVANGTLGRPGVGLKGAEGYGHPECFSGAQFPKRLILSPADL